jgi:hypothetical protein
MDRLQLEYRPQLVYQRKKVAAYGPKSTMICLQLIFNTNKQI